jgi:hypothetical protein
MEARLSQRSPNPLESQSVCPCCNDKEKAEEKAKAKERTNKLLSLVWEKFEISVFRYNQ